ncbi:MAG: hypothetical protein H6978_15760 [Gammaproteobacteria bacterium]|nr:hypothetical protein [Gammaproteobacteria bacterium]
MTGTVIAADAGHSPARQWWSPGDGAMLPAKPEYANGFGRFALVNTDGPIDTRKHPFFEPLGINGRACVTCHQPSDAMSISVETIQQRWRETQGADPLFAAVDGMNCPHLPPEKPESHSLLLERGLIRVFLPWPPKAADGSAVKPEFDIEVVRDPTGCNLHSEYGLYSENPTISVYRRPRPVINMRYVTASKFGVSNFIGKNGTLAAINPDTGKPVNMNLMADAREATVRTQAASAASGHLQAARALTPAELDAIEKFEMQLYGAQIESSGAGRLDEAGGPQALGPMAMANGRDGLLGNNLSNYVFPIGEGWYDLPDGKDADESARNAFRESVARGHDAFFYRTFWIKDSMHINSVGLGNPIKRTCATCHGMHMTAMDTANGWMDLGTTNLPWALEEPANPWNKRKAQMPLFKVTCHADQPPHPFLGRVIYTQDPGRALISGKCDDVGAIVIQQFRGLSARAPYFSNGSAASLREVVDYYDRRYNIQYSEQEKQDLVNFLSVL